MALGLAEPLLIRPDFWVNFLWKRCLGSAVLNASSSSATVRAYAFSGAPASPYALVRLHGSPVPTRVVLPPGADAHGHLDIPTAHGLQRGQPRRAARGRRRLGAQREPHGGSLH